VAVQRHERASEASNAKCPLQQLVRPKLLIHWCLVRGERVFNDEWFHIVPKGAVDGA
jgi:hypothetical protein